MMDFIVAVFVLIVCFGMLWFDVFGCFGLLRGLCL